MRPLLQPGNSVRAVWRARLDEHLGMYVIEGLHLRAASLFAVSHAVYGVTHLGALVRLLPERDPHAMIYELLEATLDHLDDPSAAAVSLVKFELAILSELGFGLDLTTCVASGVSEDLVYVSPKSGGAISRSAGEPWRDRLLRLPSFLMPMTPYVLGAGCAGWLCAHRVVPAASRARAARPDALRCAVGIHCRGDAQRRRASGVNQKARAAHVQPVPDSDDRRINSNGTADATGEPRPPAGRPARSNAVRTPAGTAAAPSASRSRMDGDTRPEPSRSTVVGAAQSARTGQRLGAASDQCDSSPGQRSLRQPSSNDACFPS